MSTQPSAGASTTKSARGCPAPPKPGKKVSKAALWRMNEVQRLAELPENAENDSCIRVSINDRARTPASNLKHRGYEFVTRVHMGIRTADWLVYKYIGKSALEPGPAAQALP